MVAIKKRKIRLEDGRSLVFFTFDRAVGPAKAKDGSNKNNCGREKCRN